MFTATPFTDKDILINDNITKGEKALWCAGYRSWPIDDDFMDAYMGRDDNLLFNLEFNDEVVGHFSIWDDEKCPEGTVRLSRGYILKKYRNKRFEGKPWAYWLAKIAIAKAKELYPDKTPYIVVYDFGMNPNVKWAISPLGLSSYKLAGFVEYDRLARIRRDNGNHFADKIWLRYEN